MATSVFAGVDVKDLPDSYVFVADMPGLKSTDVKVKLTNENVLVISGSRKPEEIDPEGTRYISKWRSSGTYLRKFVLLSDSDPDKIAAACVDGVLTVTVAKLPPPVPKKQPIFIEITMGGGQ